MAKGWSEVRLYQNQGRFRFPCGEDYGLVCFVDGDQEIGEATERFILRPSIIISTPRFPPAALDIHLACVRISRAAQAKQL